MGSVRLEKLTKKFDEKTPAVNAVTLSIEDKEFVVLVGPSGCGKSTTLRMIAGLEEISDGNIFIDNILVNDIPPKDRDIAMVFQNYALYPHMTVYENLAFGLKMRKYSKADIQQRVTQAAEILSIQELLDRKPKALSGGQRQRVALGRAIVRHPKVFLFDEPLSNLDANLRAQMRTELSRLHHRLQTTMIYVTHDQIEAMSLGDRIVVLDKGIVQQVDTPLNIYNKPVNRFVASFIGTPTMNFFPGHLENNGSFTFEPSTKAFKLRLSSRYSPNLNAYLNKPITLGIRPEHITLQPEQNTSEKITVMVEVVEPVGNETFLYFTLGTAPHHYVACVSSNFHPMVGKSLDVHFDLSKIHFFDDQNRQTIT
ncbi:MAG TPA: sn-glycerol-3-phosphate ABC transporter ATP-binding protein UgpC [Bacteroidota bacterium]|nr:sn-glycerol-3-phosphate ABC transporter ATP-binding protein UgpC [Bacteroidota bacterium]